MEYLAWLEGTRLSMWVTGSAIGFPICLIAHSIGMAFLAGANLTAAMRFYGLAPLLPLSSLRLLLPLMWWSALLCLISGLLLLVGYPAKALTNPVFYLKLSLIAAGLILVTRMQRRFAQTEDESGTGLRLQSLLLLFLWVGAITTGRFLAYTYNILTARDLYL